MNVRQLSRFLRFGRITYPRNFLKKNSCCSIQVTSCRSLSTTCTLSAKKLLKHPVDDVYLEDLYVPKSYTLEEAITTLKKYTELDLTDQDSVVHLKLNLKIKTSKKGRMQIFSFLTDLPNEFQHENKVCVFTDDSIVQQQALESGAFCAGGNDIIQQIMFNIIDCDVYLSTPEFFKQKILGNLELTKKLGKLAPRKSRGVTSEIVKEILENKDRTLLSSTRKEGSECKVVVGQIKQPVEELKQNITACLDLISDLKHPPEMIDASISCSAEFIQFQLSNNEDDDDLD